MNNLTFGTLNGLEPRRTALFSTLKQETGLRWYNKALYRQKAASDFNWLYEHGFYNIMINITTPYGKIALKEICRIHGRKKNTTIFIVNVNTPSSSERFNPLNFRLPGCRNTMNIQSLSQENFVRYILLKSGAISDETTFYLSGHWIPQWLLALWKASSDQ